MHAMMHVRKQAGDSIRVGDHLVTVLSAQSGVASLQIRKLPEPLVLPPEHVEDEPVLVLIAD